jgi:hypothetical protein
MGAPRPKLTVPEHVRDWYKQRAATLGIPASQLMLAVLMEFYNRENGITDGLGPLAMHPQQACEAMMRLVEHLTSRS